MPGLKKFKTNPKILFMKLKVLFYFTLFFYLFSCKNTTQKTANKVNSNALFVLRDSSDTNIKFINSIEDNDIINMFNYEYFYNGAGVAIGDINDDGLPDIYFGSNLDYNKLYLNLGNFKFKDITAQANVNGGDGMKTGVSMIDINGDGRLDLYVCKSGLFDVPFRKNVMYINNGNLSFTERSAEFGLDDPSYTTQTYFFDMDLDNDLDVLMVNHPINWKDINNINIYQDEKGNRYIPEDTNRVDISNRLFLNTGNNHYVDISEKAGIGNVAYGLSAIINDFNQDGYPDMYICNDYLQPDVLFINNKNNTFKKSFKDYFSHQSHSSMGSEMLDINNDGYFDMMTLDMKPEDNLRQKTLMDEQNYDRFHKMVTYGLQAQITKNCVQLNNQNNTFSEIATMLNLEYTDWSWAPIAGDFDNDGFEDLYITNGYRRYVTDMDYKKFTFDSLKKTSKINGGVSFTEWKKICPQQKIRNYFYQNNGNLSFTKKNDDWNSGPESYSNGASYADLDNDGDLDIVTNNINDEAFLLENTSNQKSKNNFVKLKLKGAGLNTQAIGATVTLVLGNGTKQYRFINPIRGFMSSVDPMVHFGLGTETVIDHLEVRWPDRSLKRYDQINMNTLNLIDAAAGVVIKPTVNQIKPILTNVTKESSLNFKHRENYYIDFKREPILHLENSSEGPAMAVGDANGDGYEDIYLGGASGQEGQLFIQKNGSFVISKQSAFLVDSIYEDVDAEFIDIDADKDLDLYVVSGGYQWDIGSKNYQDRIYINNGKGTFQQGIGIVPEEFENGSNVLSIDINGDQQMDLFVGGGASPGRYPYADQSKIFINRNGQLMDETKEWLKTISSSFGIVKDAISMDVNKDGKNDLIICGEWMPITILINDGKQLADQTKEYGLDRSQGWWQSISAGDLDGDGDEDLVVGNLGLNSKFKASEQEPVEVYAADFDGSKTMDAILCSYIMGESYPVVSRDRMLEQMTSLRKKFLRYAIYGRAKISDIFSKEILDKSYHLKSNMMSSIILWNNSNSFSIQILPQEMQKSMVKGSCIYDLNHDAKMDIISCGNFYDTDIDVGIYDASIGNVLLNDGNKAFTSLNIAQSGFYVPGNVRTIKKINFGKKQGFVVVENNGYVKLFSLNN